MAVYFDYPVHPPYDDCIVNAIAWHKNSPLLAVGYSVNNEKGYVLFYLDEAELVENSKLEKSTIPVSLVWHPTRKILASGWKNGEISLWNEHDKECHDCPVFHKTAVTNMQWNGTGSRLLTADQSGLLLIWKVDQRGRSQQSPMFQNDLSSPIVEMLFKISIGADIAVGMAAAARAAVSGDESALDMFDWQKSGQSKFSMSHAESIQMYVATKDGNVYFLDERGKCNNCFQVEGSAKYLLYYESKGIILTITESLMLFQHILHPEGGGYQELSKVKLSGNPSNFQVSWAGPGLIVSCCKERVARIIDIDNDQNFVINLSGHSGFQNTEMINCLCFNQKRGVLAGGTNLGHVAVWKYNAAKADDNPWELQPPSEVRGVVTNIEWGANGGLMAANSGTSVTILSESIMNAHFNDQVAAIQVTPNHLLVEMFPSQEASDLKTDVHIKGVYCTKNNIAIWNRRKIAVYELSQNKSIVRSAGTFNSDASTVAVYEQNIYLIESEKICIKNFQGTTKQELTFLEQEGIPCELNICGSFLAVGTTKSVIKIYDLSRREARQVSITKVLEDTIPNIGSIHSLKCNCNGTKISIISQNNFSTSSILHIWDVESDTVQSFDFLTGTGSEHLDDGLISAQAQLTSSIKSYVPQVLFWDTEEPKLLVCEAAKSSSEKPMGRPSFLRKESSLSTIQPEVSNLIVTMFSTPDHGIIVQDHFNKDSSYSKFLGVQTPHYYFVQSSSTHQSGGDEKEAIKERVFRHTMRDFVGLENADNEIKKAMTDFSYLSAVGNMDDAFKAIKSIKSGSVWENMARMCVKTKRLDVAMVCLGNMGNAIAAKAVRECQREETDLNVQVAMLAVQIGMYDEAEELYKESRRYDLLNKFFQASNQWEKAVECAESNDRIHLRTTHYKYGRYLEEQENYVEAIKHFERSETYRIEVPRMLFDDFEKLEGYISQMKDQKLFRWWAQYLESAGEMGDALRYYELSQDYHAMVRIHCFCEELNKAEKICNETGDKAACYHLARQLDSADDFKGAIHYFSRAKAYSNAIRMAKENELDGELMNMALLSSPEDMLDCARYFEVKGGGGMEDKAVILYHKGGRPSKAIDLAFKTEQFGALQMISEDLDENADPEVLRKCAEFFIDHGQFDKAVNLLVVARRFDEALQMCLDHHITITEDLAENMTLPKEHPDAKYRLKILERVGEVAFKQGSYHLATKKFTQAGNKIKAMKALLKSGDTEKIVFFAGVSRQKEIYIMAANYLQSLDWRKDPEIMKGIINFYTKGRALDSLASFYDACAQVEIDEFQNYAKAFGALSEAYKCLSKAKPKNQTEQEERLASIKMRLTVMKKYIQAQKVYQTNVDESIKTCALLLDDPDIDIAVRVGDIYSFIIQHYASVKDFNHAYSLMSDMKQRYPSLKLRHYIKPSLIEQIHRVLDIPLPAGVKNSRNNGMNRDNIEESDGEEVMEEVDDEMGDDDDMI